jgi:hypothetical protein
MSPVKATLLMFIGISLFTILGIGGCVVSIINREVDLRKSIQAKSISNEATLDTMWKTIKQKAKISDKAVSEIKDMNQVYTELVEGRAGGSLMKMVTENYPDLGQAEVAKFYMEVMASVESERKVFKRDQQALVDLVRERDAMIHKIPASFILGMFGDITGFYRRGHTECPEGHPDNYTYMFVTARDTKVMVETGEENDIDLFD